MNNKENIVEAGQEKYITFCIPSFNRGDKVAALVSEILQYKGMDIEVVVLDNCSTDNTVSLLQEIKDDRFRLIENDNNIGGILNCLKVLTLANGKYAAFCLDKDGVISANIEILINILKKEKDISFGYCALNLEKESEYIVYSKAFSSVYNMSYLSSHPTGRFYKADVFKRLLYVEQRLKDTNTKFAFDLDIINAQMAFEGRSLLINTPLFYTERSEESARVLSHTYKKLEDVFFFPEQRLKEYSRYMESADSLHLAFNEKYKLIKKIYQRGLSSSLEGYKASMDNKSVCNHYHLRPQKISVKELILIDYNYNKAFLVSEMGLSRSKKICILLTVEFKRFLIFCYHLLAKLKMDNK